jgi:hypothetical protein
MPIQYMHVCFGQEEHHHGDCDGDMMEENPFQAEVNKQEHGECITLEKPIYSSLTSQKYFTEDFYNSLSFLAVSLISEWDQPEKQFFPTTDPKCRAGPSPPPSISLRGPPLV